MSDPAGGGSAHTDGLADRVRGRLLGGDDGDTRLSGVQAWWLALLAAQALALAGYFLATGASVTRPGYVLAPFVWIDVGLWAVLRTASRARPSVAEPGRRFLAGALAAGYFLSLLWVTGLLGRTAGGVTAGFDVSVASPGWGPIVTYLGPLVHVTVVPYRVLGYLALAYLVYAALVRTTRVALSGVVGLASCVSCGLSVVAATVAAATGGSSAALAAVYGVSVEVSTAVYLLAVGLLVWGVQAAEE